MNALCLSIHHASHLASSLYFYRRYGKKKALLVQGYFSLFDKKEFNCCLFIHKLE